MIISQKKIALKAGVSQNTVSLYFRRRDMVAEETCRKIERIVKKYNYLPNSAAHCMKTRKFNRIACMVVMDAVSRPHIISYINSISMCLMTYGYSLVLVPFLFDNETEELIDKTGFFDSHSVDGIICIAGSHIPRSIDKLLGVMPVPVVWINRDDIPGGMHGFCFDESKGTEILVNHFFEQCDCKSLSWFGPDYVIPGRVHYSAKIRCENVVLAAEAKGMEVRTIKQVNTWLLEPARKLLRSVPLPDVFICDHFDYVYALDQAALELGMKVPGDFRIGHFASYWEHEGVGKECSTYVLLPEKEVAANAAEYLVSCIQEREDSKISHSVIPQLHVIQ